MLYSLARPTIHDGSLICCGSQHLVSQMIQQSIRSDVSHPEFALWLRFDDEQSWRLCSIGSVGHEGGVRITPLAELLAKYRKMRGHVWLYPLLPEHLEKGHRIVAEALRLWPSPYPRLTQHLLTVAAWLRWVRWKVFGKRPDLDPTAYHCWEFGASVLANAGWQFDGEACEVSLTDVAHCKWFGPRSELELPRENPR